jgi:DNA-directed RNA polymerase subunit RPC12/RpoP
MNAKCPCQNCTADIEFEAEQAGQRVSCPHCGETTLLFIVPEVAEPAPAPAKTEPRLKRLTVREAVLNHTQYSNGRSVVNWTCGLMTVAGICGFLAIFASFVRDVAGNNDYRIDSSLVFFSSITCLLSAWIMWHVAHAIFDMADCALRRFEADDNENSN